MAVVNVNHLTYHYPHQPEPVLNDLSVTFPAGKFSLLTGISGGGKSTLLKLIAGLLPNSDNHGTIAFDGQPWTSIPVSQRAQTVAMLFQEPSLQFTMDTVENECRFVLENLQVAPDAMPDRITTALSFIGITNLRHRNLMTLSGGEQQKVALAIIVAMNSDVILLDEPFASIDPAARQILLNKLVALCTDHGKTIVLADHDLSGYAHWVDHLAVLEAGQVTLLTPAETQARFAKFVPEKLAIHPMIPSNDAATVLQGTQLGLTQGDRVLLEPQGLPLYEHKTTLITGPNGSGKSTLFRALVRLGKYQGVLTYQGTNIQKIRQRRYARQVSLMFQTAAAQFLNVTVAEELALSLKYGRSTDFSAERLDGLLTRLGLNGRQDQVLYSLSSGQQKKLQLLCMLIMAPPVLLLDEPFKGLDLASVTTVVALLREVQAEFNLTLILVSHQLSGLDELVDYHLKLDDQHLQYVGVSHES
ncbi:ABC-type cobalt transport system, ATPase component [Levilactobacillus senmaizukei DSM 21775 = NBRC 103853]|uniref:ABC-type cobalt transport system, ATPase component n=1 Tax=Levilactobacillus senmaizukei DSM 21775 = NBRC 103853 TaxID=1423803 RepID=A0A0R2DSN5_9LACO|nr:ABC transporter ATP-binding protein [Levilactobacillus senmaizukei]KRN03402.1 ABC-type cobalt transport system, ATPase component [Levilactobacillus senmaizukei DSM 21775 = NBRC 103853]